MRWRGPALIAGICLLTAGLVGLWRHQTAPAVNQPLTAYQFADGSRQPFPGNRFISLYGTPGDPALGALGEQGPAASVARARRLAEDYRPGVREHLTPSLEIIATIASAEPTANKDYSRETDVAALRPWVAAARQAGVYVILDLQPGSTPFDVQAKQYAALLREPNVGLALDPEWRLQPGKQHLQDIGSVGIAEVNRTAAWLSQLTRQQGLPDKIFLLHQFRLSMISDRAQLRAQPALASVIQMDGQGDQSLKQQTYAAITAGAPAHVRFGWKNFYAKDAPMLSPAQTMAQRPQPWYISYQ